MGSSKKKKKNTKDIRDLIKSIYISIYIKRCFKNSMEEEKKEEVGLHSVKRKDETHKLERKKK